MDQDGIVVERGIPERFREAAAAIFVEAFQAKIQRLAGTSEGTVQAVADQLDLDMAMAAFTPDRLLGIAGFFHEGRHFGNPRPGPCIRRLGLLRGLLLYLNVWLFVRSAGRPGEFVMDGIAVTADARGRGIGKRLLDAITDFARGHGYHCVSLGVADTNPRARELYVREGFIPVRTVQYPLANGLFGLSAVTFMRKPLEPAPGDGPTPEAGALERMPIWGVGPRIVLPSVATMVVGGLATWMWPFVFGLWWLPEGPRILLARVLGGVGLFILAAAVRPLRSAYMGRRLVTGGVYGWVRHPLYSAWLVFVFPALALFSNSWLMLAGPIVGAVRFGTLIGQEEMNLVNQFGHEYLDYRDRVPALIPSWPKELWPGGDA